MFKLAYQIWFPINSWGSHDIWMWSVVSHRTANVPTGQKRRHPWKSCSGVCKDECSSCCPSYISPQRCPPWRRWVYFNPTWSRISLGASFDQSNAVKVTCLTSEVYLCFCYGTPPEDYRERHLVSLIGGWGSMRRWVRYHGQWLAPVARHKSRCHGPPPTPQLLAAVCILHWDYLS